MDIQLLRNKEIFPSEQVLIRELGQAYPAFFELMDNITAEYALVPHWNWYNDGKAWLCKVTYKKKTIFWLSVWKDYFRTGFFFATRHSEELFNLDISPGLKEQCRNNKPIGKLIFLMVNVSDPEQIEDVIKLINFKKRIN